MLSARNRVLLFVMWLRMYPTYTLLSNIFGVSVTVVGAEITSLSPVLWPCSCLANGRGLAFNAGYLDWASNDSGCYRWYLAPDIQTGSGTKGTVLFRTPALYLYTQVACDGTIRYIESGYAGHLNDEQQFGTMQQLGFDRIFPEELCLLAGKLDPNRTPVYLRS